MVNEVMVSYRLISNKIRWMALFCAVLVVCIHAPYNKNDDVVMRLYSFWSHGVGKIAVPFFFASAGYFLAKHIGDPGWHKAAVAKRFKSLIVPLVIWDMIYYCTFSITFPLMSKFSGGGGVVSMPDLGAILRILAIDPFHQPSLGVLWFMRVLFLLVLASPILIKIANPLSVALLWLANGIIYPDYGTACTPIVFTLQEGFLSVFGVTWF